jgi:hypothetical protein
LPDAQSMQKLVRERLFSSSRRPTPAADAAFRNSCAPVSSLPIVVVLTNAAKPAMPLGVNAPRYSISP